LITQKFWGASNNHAEEAVINAKSATICPSMDTYLLQEKNHIFYSKMTRLGSRWFFLMKITWSCVAIRPQKFMMIPEEGNMTAIIQATTM
jgi:hypothetical protein